VAALLLVGVLLGAFGVAHVKVNQGDMTLIAGALAASVRVVGTPLLIAGGTAISAYLLDCLYAERRDRSILFWKSMPVSDTRTVLVKFAVAVVITPLGVYGVAVVTHAISSIVMLSIGGANAFMTWTYGEWFLAQGEMLVQLLLTLVWYAPMAAYLMLASVYARRTPMLIAVLPPLALGLGEKLLFGTSYVLHFVVERLAPATTDDLTSPGLWLGVVATAGLLLVVIRLRRYRDDT
jgi:ABC-2 type transport system permease protein